MGFAERGCAVVLSGGELSVDRCESDEGLRVEGSESFFGVCSGCHFGGGGCDVFAFGR